MFRLAIVLNGVWHMHLSASLGVFRDIEAAREAAKKECEIAGLNDIVQIEEHIGTYPRGGDWKAVEAYKRVE